MGALGRASWDSSLTRAGRRVATRDRAHVPQRLAAALLTRPACRSIAALPMLRRDERTALVERLTSYVLPWTGDEGFKKAEVTGGGVALDEVDPRTLESRRHRGLFLCGEMLDAFGPIGGHNFAWAWATGRLAGIAARYSSQVERSHEGTTHTKMFLPISCFRVFRGALRLTGVRAAAGR